MGEKGIKLKVRGDYACFTRPDLKVERVSYPCMTPSAARGILDAILWKPEFIWHVHRILILKPIRFLTIKRNEIKPKQSKNPIIIEDKRSQRNSVILKDVEYVIEATVEKCNNGNPPQKYLEMFKRRVKKGQCYRRPFLGNREFSCEFSLADGSEEPINEIYPIGSMLLDLFYDKNGNPTPKYFYNVVIKDGVLNCSNEYLEMYESTHIRPARKAESADLDTKIAEEEIDD